MLIQESFNIIIMDVIIFGSYNGKIIEISIFHINIGHIGGSFTR